MRKVSAGVEYMPIDGLAAAPEIVMAFPSVIPHPWASAA